nr:SH3 domain-containing protein [Bacillus sp. REN10]
MTVNTVYANSAPGVSKASGEYTVTAHQLNVRSGASIKSSLLGSLPKGSTIQVTGKTANNWYRFTYDKQEAYVNGAYLTKKTNHRISPAMIAKTKTAQQTDQIVTVVGSGSKAYVEYWEKNQLGQWTSVLKTTGHVGSKGVGQAREGSKFTPKGAYKLGFAFGHSNPGTKMPFKPITKNSYWISNPKDSQYNTWQERTKSSKLDERLINYRVQYKYAIVINYNTYKPVKGAGSAFFLHVDNGGPTAGCVSVSESHMRQFMRQLHDNAYIMIVNNQSEIAKY